MVPNIHLKLCTHLILWVPDFQKEALCQSPVEALRALYVDGRRRDVRNRTIMNLIRSPCNGESEKGDDIGHCSYACMHPCNAQTNTPSFQLCHVHSIP